MKILYDHQTFNLQTYGGISRYFFELMNQFSKWPDVRFELSLRYSDNHYLENSGFADYRSFCGGYKFRGRNIIMRFFNERNSRKSLIKQDFDVFHPTYYGTYFLDCVGGRPFVLTIYDMIHEIFGGSLPAGDKTAENKRALAQRAAKIIAISENTKKDIIKYYGVDEDKISVIYLGNSLAETPARTVNLALPEKYLLFVGARIRYKNFDKFIRSVRPLMEQDDKLNIVCTGVTAFSIQEKQMFDDLKIRNRVHWFMVNDSELAALYRRAVAFVFPSLYEGFGIPVLEAFACGCPAILSRTSSLPEIGGDAVEYFDPENEDDIRETVRKVITDKNKQKDLRQKGIVRVKQFSWEKTAKQTLDVYRSII